MERKADDGVEDVHEEEGAFYQVEEHAEDADDEVVLRVAGVAVSCGFREMFS